MGIFCRFGSLELKPAGGGDGLIERGVNLARPRIDHLGKFIDIGVLQFDVLPVFQDKFGQGMFPGQFLKDGDVRGPPGLG